MSEGREARGPGWRLYAAFFIADLLLVAVAVWLCWQGRHPLAAYEAAAAAFCVFGGALFGVWPFVLEHRAWLKRMETEEVLGAVRRLEGLERTAQMIEQATNAWQMAQDAAEKTARSAEEIARRMTEEQERFQEFLQQANDTERAHLRLEVEKLRRDEAEWVRALVFILDHTHALFAAALRSGRQDVAAQIGRFRAACLDAARRVGLATTAPKPGERFDPERHAAAGPEKTDEGEWFVQEVLAPGYRFRGAVARKPLVRAGPTPPEPPKGREADSACASPEGTSGAPSEAGTVQEEASAEAPQGEAGQSEGESGSGGTISFTAPVPDFDPSGSPEEKDSDEPGRGGEG